MVIRIVVIGAGCTILFCLGYFLAAVVLGIDPKTAGLLAGAFALLGMAIVFRG
jgi:hypothetical protein